MNIHNIAVLLQAHKRQFKRWQIEKAQQYDGLETSWSMPFLSGIRYKAYEFFKPLSRPPRFGEL
jgi:hypothetical protein